jgi:hypothetical protein
VQARCLIGRRKLRYGAILTDGKDAILVSKSRSGEHHKCDKKRGAFHWLNIRSQGAAARGFVREAMRPFSSTRHLILGITGTPYLLHRYPECLTMPAWHASAASSPLDFRITLPQGFGRGLGLLPDAKSRAPRAYSAAARYVALNPVRARLVACAEDWAWSSARAHLAGRDDALVRVAPALDRIGRFCDLIDSEDDRLAFAALRASETTGRALGSSDFIATLECATGRRLRPKKPGRKPSAPTDQLQLRMPGMNSDG